MVLNEINLDKENTSVKKVKKEFLFSRGTEYSRESMENEGTSGNRRGICWRGKLERLNDFRSLSHADQNLFVYFMVMECHYLKTFSKRCVSYILK